MGGGEDNNYRTLQERNGGEGKSYRTLLEMSGGEGKQQNISGDELRRR